MQDDAVATSWLNDVTVRRAIHAKEVSAPIACGISYLFRILIILYMIPLNHQDTVIGSWDLCTDKITFAHDAGSMIKYHKNLTSRGYRALIYR